MAGGLAGNGAITIWQDVRPEARADFFRWHNGEHIAERVGIPGFLRGRRYAALEGAPEFFTLYETVGPQVHTSPEYLARLNQPTEQTRRVAPMMVNNVRSLCRVAWTHGAIAGGLVATLRFEAEDEAAMLPVITQALASISAEEGVVGAHLCLADKGASSVRTEEKKARPTAALVPGWVVLVEGGAERDSLWRAVSRHLDDRALEKDGARDILRGLYILQVSLSR